MAVNWGMAVNRVDPGQMFMQGLERGQSVAKERRVQNAFAAYAQNPDDPQAVNTLMQADPRIGMQVREDQTRRMEAQQRRDVTGRALQGDKDALGQLAGIDPQMWMKVDETVKAKVKQATEFMSNAGYEIGRLPEEQRAAAWSNYVRQAEASGMDIPAQYETYTPEAFRAAMAEAGQTKSWLESMEPKTMVVPAGGTIYEMGQPGLGQQPVTPTQATPQAPAQATGAKHMTAGQFGTMARSMGPQRVLQWQQQHKTPVMVNSPQEMAALPPGTIVISPDGRTGVKR